VPFERLPFLLRIEADNAPIVYSLSMSAALFMGYEKPCLMRKYASRLIKDNSKKVIENPIAGSINPKTRTNGIAATIVSVGDKEYILFLILVGMTSIITRCVRMFAKYVVKLVKAKKTSTSTMGTIDSAGISMIVTYVNGMRSCTMLPVSVGAGKK